MGEISSKISSRPDFVGTSFPLSSAASTRDFQASLPSSQSKLSVWSARRLGTSRGSLIFAKEIRSGAVLAPLFELAVEAVREAAKRGSFRGLGLSKRIPVPLATGREQLTGSAKGQCSPKAHWCPQQISG